jgi:hypothetical protein
MNALLERLETWSNQALRFELLEALLACGPSPAVAAWVSRVPTALSRSLLLVALADARRTRGEPSAAVAAALDGALHAALGSPHPLPTIALLPHLWPAALPVARAHIEGFAVRPGEWFQGAHAVLAESLAAEDPAAAARHLEEALRPRPSFPARIARHESALEAVVLSSVLAHRQSALGRTAEAQEQRAQALYRFARGMGTGDTDDHAACFDLSEEDGISDWAAVRRAMLAVVFPLLSSDGEIGPLRSAGSDLFAGALAAAGRLDEARAVASELDGHLGVPVRAAIAAAAPDESAAVAALNEAGRGCSPAEVQNAYEEGLLLPEERFAIQCALGRAYGRRGQAEYGLRYLAPLVDEARESFTWELNGVRGPLAAALRGEILAPSALFAPMSDRQIERARKRPESIRAGKLLFAAAGRPGADGDALLDEALACNTRYDLEIRESSDPDSWLAAYAVHGRLADARRASDLLYRKLLDRGNVALGGVAAFVLALHAAGRKDEAASELARWLDLSPDPVLVPAVLSVAAQHGALGQLAAPAEAALGRIDARVEAYRL